MKFTTGIWVLAVIAGIVALAVDCAEKSPDQYCRDLARKKHIDVWKVGIMYIYIAQLKYSCSVHCQSFDKDFSLEYVPNPDPSIHLCCCGSTEDTSRVSIERKAKPLIKRPAIKESDEQKCRQYAAEKHVDVSFVESFTLVKISPGGHCPAVCDAMRRDFSLKYKEPNTCCCGKIPIE